MKHILPVLITAALTCLALGMERHHHPALGRKPTRRIRNACKSAGWIMLALAAPVAVAAYGWPVGAVTLFAWLAFTGFALTLCLAYAPRFTPVCTAAMGAVMALLSFWPGS
jgi:hypothetical protein